MFIRRAARQERERNTEGTKRTQKAQEVTLRRRFLCLLCSFLCLLCSVFFPSFPSPNSSSADSGSSMAAWVRRHRLNNPADVQPEPTRVQSAAGGYSR